MTCKYCDSKNLIQQLCSEGVHYGKECCADCGKFLRWLPKPNTERPRRPASHRDLTKKFSRGFCELCLIEENDLPPRQTFEAHHIIEYQYGGTDDRTNIQVLCSKCHRQVHWLRIYTTPAAEASR